MIIYLIRHAEPIADKQGTDREKLSHGLSKFGRMQARAVGKRMRGLGVKTVISSPIIRARETAEIISGYLDIEISIDDRLKEFFTDIDVSDGDDKKTLKMEARNQPDKVYPSGESLNQAVYRFYKALKDIADRGTQPVAVVTHRMVTEAFLSRTFGIRNGDINWLKICAVTAIEPKEEAFRLIFVNRIYRDLPMYLRIVRNRLRS